MRAFALLPVLLSTVAVTMPAGAHGQSTGASDAARLEHIASLEAAGPSALASYFSAVIEFSTALINQGRYREALPVLTRAHAVAERNFGPDHATTRELRATIALLQPFVRG